MRSGHDRPEGAVTFTGIRNCGIECRDANHFSRSGFAIGCCLPHVQKTMKKTFGVSSQRTEKQEAESRTTEFHLSRTSIFLLLANSPKFIPSRMTEREISQSTEEILALKVQRRN